MSSKLKYVGLKVSKSTNPNTPSEAGALYSKLIINNKSCLKSKSNVIKEPAIYATAARFYNHFTCKQNNPKCLQEKQQYRCKSTSTNIKYTTSLLGRFIKSLDKKTKTLSSFHKYKNIMDAPPGVFKGSLDRFNGITIDSEAEYNENENFSEKLKKSLDHWQSENRRAIWFHVKTAHSDWVPHLTKMNFEFHHAKCGMVVLYRWLPKDEYPNLPVYSHTMLGVGGLVVNDKNEVLVVSERFALIPNSWKLPGGYAEPHENIIDAAIREVREETGIETVFNTVISLRHSHGGPFGCSDIYCVVALTPTTIDLQRCEREIAKVQWMPCNEYLEHPNVHETNRHFLRCYLDYKKRGIRFTCEKAKHQILKKEYCLYYMKAIKEDEAGDSNQTSKVEEKL